jgi:hypothetical protein
VIGFAAWLPKLGFVLVASLFVYAFARGWIAVLLRRSTFSGEQLFASAFLVLWLGLFIQLFVREFFLHHTLQNLRPDSIASIEANGRSLTDPGQIAAVTGVLNHPQSFSVNHGGWADTVPLIVRLKSGDAQYYEVGYYFRRDGAIVDATPSPSSHSLRWSSGYVFYQDLPSVLASAGVTLPRCQHRYDGGFCTSCEHPCPARLP